MPLYRAAFTNRSFYTETPSHRAALQREAFSQRRLCTEQLWPRHSYTDRFGRTFWLASGINLVWSRFGREIWWRFWLVWWAWTQAPYFLRIAHLSRQNLCIRVHCVHSYSFIYVQPLSHSFIHFYTYAFSYSYFFIFIFVFIFSHAFMPSCLHAFMRSFIHSVSQSFSHSVVFSHSVIQSFIHSFIHPFIHSFIHSCIHAFMHPPPCAVLLCNSSGGGFSSNASSKKEPLYFSERTSHDQIWTPRQIEPLTLSDWHDNFFQRLAIQQLNDVYAIHVYIYISLSLSIYPCLDMVPESIHIIAVG